MWIEIYNEGGMGIKNRSRPVRALWIEIFLEFLIRQRKQSRPVRALWIEIQLFSELGWKVPVEAREGLVD